MSYKEISSAFIRERLKNTEWKNHETIDELLTLDAFIQKAPTTRNGFIKFEHLKHLYPAEFLQLLGDFSPELLKAELLKQEEAKAQVNARLALRKSEENAKLLEWLNAGGQN